MNDATRTDAASSQVGVQPNDAQIRKAAADRPEFNEVGGRIHYIEADEIVLVANANHSE